MKRTVVLTSVSVMLLAVCLWTLDAWARARRWKIDGESRFAQLVIAGF